MLGTLTIMTLPPTISYPEKGQMYELEAYSQVVDEPWDFSCFCAKSYLKKSLIVEVEV